MSRRTKVVTLLVVLAFVAIAAVNLAVTWSPESPLQFHLSNLRSSDDGDWFRELSVDVENTSGATIYLSRAVLRGPENPEGYYDSISSVDLQDASSAVSGYSIAIIPPHSTRRFTLGMFDSQAERADFPRTRMEYHFSSRSKHHVLRLMDYLDRKWPYVYDHLPKVYMEEEVVPIQSYRP